MIKSILIYHILSWFLFLQDSIWLAKQFLELNLTESSRKVAAEIRRFQLFCNLEDHLSGGEVDCSKWKLFKYSSLPFRFHDYHLKTLGLEAVGLLGWHYFWVGLASRDVQLHLAFGAFCSFLALFSVYSLPLYQWIEAHNIQYSCSLYSASWHVVVYQ